MADAESDDERAPVVVADGHVEASGIEVAYYSRHIDDVLVAFLELMRMCRGSAEGPVLEFRRMDVDALAEGLNYPGEAIVGRLAILIGAQEMRRRSMVRGYEQGVPSISAGQADMQVPREEPDLDVGDGSFGDRPSDGPLRRLLLEG